MKAIKNFYTIISLIVLMILRPFSPGEWFGSVAIAGLFVTWVDTIQKVWKANNKLTLEQEKVRYAVVMLVLSLFGLVQLINSNYCQSDCRDRMAKSSRCS